MHVLDQAIACHNGRLQRRQNRRIVADSQANAVAHRQIAAVTRDPTEFVQLLRVHIEYSMCEKNDALSVRKRVKKARKPEKITRKIGVAARVGRRRKFVFGVLQYDMTRVL